MVIRFIGGPLDGSTAKTDEWPNSQMFHHRFGTLDYLYFYRQTEKSEFVAEFCGIESAENGAQSPKFMTEGDRHNVNPGIPQIWLIVFALMLLAASYLFLA